MELSEITKVVELTNYNDVNEYLDLGWKTIGFYTTAYADFPGSTQTPHYILMWVGSNPHYPEKPEETTAPW